MSTGARQGEVLGLKLGSHTFLFIGGAVGLSAAVYAALRVPAVVKWRAPSRPHLEAGSRCYRRRRE
jgi:hypothetical protein